MNEMIERVAAAIGEAEGIPWRNRNDRQRLRLLKNARAAIAAMRGPTEAMIVDGFEAMRGEWKQCKDAAADAEACWRAMIEAALVER